MRLEGAACCQSCLHSQMYDICMIQVHELDIEKGAIMLAPVVILA